jgi:hypothetical protein
MGFPGIPRVRRRLAKLFERLLVLLGLLERTPTLIVLVCEFRLFHARIPPFVTRVEEANFDN